MKRSQKLIPGFAFLVLVIALLISSCQKDVSATDQSGQARNLSIFLTDDPCQYDSVFIDIRTLEVKIDTSRHRDDDHFGENEDHDGDDDHEHHDEFGKWDTLNIRAGVYNILQLRNGIDTLLATGNIPAGAVRKIRITLGTNNRIVVAGISHPLLLEGNRNFVYIKIHKEHEDDLGSGRSGIWLDFNVCESIKFNNGQYYLKPYLKPFGHKNFGKIEGKVFPAAAHAIVIARNATDSASAMPEHDGEYEMQGLKAGSYTVTFDGITGYRDTVLTNVQVQAGKETKLPSITLHP
ncbi:MAG: DUF4382 domain-containing protein [Ferruginibacter sp.]